MQIRMNVPTNDEDSELLIESCTSTGRRVSGPFRQMQIVLVLVVVSVCVLLAFTMTSNLLQPSLLPSQQQELHHVSSPVVISHDAWQEMMNVIHTNLNDPYVSGDSWLPIILRGRSIYCREQHVNGFQGNQRFEQLIGILEYALAYGMMVETNTTKTTWRLVRSNHTHSRREQQQEEASVSHLPALFANRTSIPLVFFMGDDKTCYGTIFPRFAWCTMWESEKNCTVFPIPTYTVFQSQPEQSPDQHVFHATLEHKYPWSTKRRQAVWRGAATGEAPHGWASLPRAKLVNYSLLYPDLFDAAFVDTSQFILMYPDDEHSKLRSFSRFADRMAMNDYQKYRAVVDIDGNSWSARFGELLCMNTVVIKVYPRNKNYFFDQLQPWQHYIPVKNDLSDLVDAIRFAISDENVQKVQQIIHRANEFCRIRLSRRRMGEDTYWMLHRYMQLLGDNATRWRQWEDLYQDYQQNFTFVNVTRYNPVPDEVYY